MLSLFTATEHHEPFLNRTSEYIDAVDRALRDGRRFVVRFHGLTASPGAVMTQGFPEDGTLGCLRAQVRSRLRQAGLGKALDQRYRLETAHVTVARFQQPHRNRSLFLERLIAYRRHEFGHSQVSQVQLVENDWYMSSDRVKVLKTYAFS